MTKPRHGNSIQTDLFDAPVTSHDLQPDVHEVSAFDPDSLGDDETIAEIAGANLTKAELLCEQVVSRRLEDAAVPALEELWDRFRGFGLNRPCREQVAVLRTLAKIKTERSRALVKRIALGFDLPAVALPYALEAAVACRTRFLQGQIEQWVVDERPIVRALAFSLARWSAPPVWMLEAGTNDPDLSVQKAALITFGKLGYVVVRSGLLSLLARTPDSDVVRAVAAVADEKVIVRLGRCAEEHDWLRSEVLNELRAMDEPMAMKVARRLERR